MTIPKSISEDGKLLSTSEAAEKLGVHRSTVHHWIKTGVMKSERHGSFHAITPAELKRFKKIYDLSSDS